jgi:hypothetical protein
MVATSSPCVSAGALPRAIRSRTTTSSSARCRGSTDDRTVERGGTSPDPGVRKRHRPPRSGSGLIRVDLEGQLSNPASAFTQTACSLAVAPLGYGDAGSFTGTMTAPMVGADGSLLWARWRTGSVVTLTETVDRQYQRDEAELVAGNLPGVVAIENDIYLADTTPGPARGPRWP